MEIQEEEVKKEHLGNFLLHGDFHYFAEFKKK